MSVIQRQRLIRPVQYRAWNGLKAMTDGSNHVTSLAYNSRLQATQFDISGGVVHQNYDYQNDGRVSFVHHTSDTKFDRSYFYDHAGRLTEAKSGGQARGDAGESPYYETFGYDAFSNLTARQSNNWNQDVLFDSSTYANHRRSGWGYDGDGRNTSIGTRTYSFDADGQVTSMTGQIWINNHYVNITQTIGYDGDGQKVKEGLAGAPTYYVRSTVLDGAIIEEIDNSGQKKIGYVYTSDGEVLAKQVVDGSYSYVVWKHGTPAGTGQHDWAQGPAFGNGVLQRVELDPMGADVAIEAPQTSDLGGGEGDIGSSHFSPVVDSRWSNFFDLAGGCSVAGVVASCSKAMSPGEYLQAQTRAMLGDRWYDLPGNDNEIERALGAHVSQVQRTFAGYKSNHQPNTKPKTAPRLRKRGDRRARRVGAVTRPRRTTGTPQGEEQPQGGTFPPVTPSEVNIVFGGRQFEFVQNDIVNAIVDIANRQACKDAFLKHGLTRPYDVVKSGNLRVAGRAVLYEPNAPDLLRWSQEQVNGAIKEFEKEDGWWGTGFRPAYTADLSYPDISTVVYNASQVRAERFGGLKDVVTHSFIHLGGRRGNASAAPHDLADFGGYQEILNACR